MRIQISVIKIFDRKGEDVIAFIEGKVLEKNPDYFILLHEGVGFRLNYDPLAAGRLPEVGQEARIYTYLHVREDELSLYAFPTYEEKQLFELLLTVSGFGPRISSTMVASMPPDRFALAVVNGDVKALSSVKGVGRKSAERLILELKDKLKKRAGQVPAVTAENAEAEAVFNDTAHEEVLSALLLLGYSQKEAAAALSRVLKNREDVPKLEELIRLSLRELAPA